MHTLFVDACKCISIIVCLFKYNYFDIKTESVMKILTLSLTLVIISLSDTYSQDYKSRNHKLSKSNFHKVNDNPVEIQYVKKKGIDLHYSKDIVKFNKENSGTYIIYINSADKSNYMVSSDKNSRMKYYKNIPSRSENNLTGKVTTDDDPNIKNR